MEDLDDDFIFSDEEMENECTCTNCRDVDDCAYAFAPENINGNCLADDIV